MDESDQVGIDARDIAVKYCKLSSETDCVLYSSEGLQNPVVCGSDTSVS